MQCPRCNLGLRETEYEGVKVEICDSCWGFWLDRGELEIILGNRTYVFSKDERDLILAILGPSDRLKTDAAACPKCSEIMNLHRFDDQLPIAIDECPQHGVWLDTGEIKELQLMVEKSAYFHQTMIRVLRG